MKQLVAFFRSLPRWYLVTLGVLFLAYMCGWVYTVHVASVERAAGAEFVIPVAEHDPSSYAYLAQSILHGHFAEPNEQYHYFHTPGYPAMVAAIYAVTGSYLAVTFVQVLMLFVIALMTYALAARLVSPHVGYWASLLFLVNPVVPANVYWLVTDILYTFLLILGFLLIVTQFEKSPLKTTLIVAVLFGAAVYVRPVGFLAYPIFIAPLLALAYPWRKKIAYAALMLCVTTLLLVPWLVRNYVHSGVVGFSSLASFNMAYYSIPHYWFDTEHLPLEQGFARVEQESGAPAGFDTRGYPKNWYNLTSSPKLSAFYQKVIFSQPFKYVPWHLFYSTGFYFSPAISPPHLSKNIKLLLLRGHVVEAVEAVMTPWWFFVERIFLFGGLALLCFGVWSLRRNWLALAFVLVILYTSALGGPSTAARYRLPVEPLLSIFMVAGAGLILRLNEKNLSRNGHTR